jgi:hypothetical protein
MWHFAHSRLMNSTERFAFGRINLPVFSSFSDISGIYTNSINNLSLDRSGLNPLNSIQILPDGICCLKRLSSCTKLSGSPLESAKAARMVSRPHAPERKSTMPSMATAAITAGKATVNQETVLVLFSTQPPSPDSDLIFSKAIIAVILTSMIAFAIDF